MRKQIAHTMVLMILLVSFGSTSLAQSYSDDEESDGYEQNYDGYDNEEDDREFGYNNDGARVSERTTIEYHSQFREGHNTLALVAKPASSETSTGTAARGSRTTDADCPECTPDPAGDVVDVPFDKRMHALLIAAGLIVVIKTSRKKKDTKNNNE